MLATQYSTPCSGGCSVQHLTLSAVVATQYATWHLVQCWLSRTPPDTQYISTQCNTLHSSQFDTQCNIQHPLEHPELCSTPSTSPSIEVNTQLLGKTLCRVTSTSPSTTASQQSVHMSAYSTPFSKCCSTEHPVQPEATASTQLQRTTQLPSAPSTCYNPQRSP